MHPFPIELEDGRSTSAIRYEPAGRAEALLVLAHGAGAGQRHPFMTAVAKGLADRGVAVVTFDFLYMHERRRAPDRTELLEDTFRRAIAAAAHAADTGRLFIGGKSMGGRIATHLAAQPPANIRGAVAFGYPLHPPGKPEQLRIAHFAGIHVPLLVVQGERDAFGTPEELRTHVGNIPSPVALHAVAGADHSLAVKGRSQADVLGPVLDVAREWMTSL